MLASFFFSALAGYLTRHVEAPLEALIARVIKVDIRLDALEFRVLTFGLMLMLAAVATALVGADSSAYMAATGALLGFFGKDLYAFLRDPNKTGGVDEDDWDGELDEAGRRRVKDHGSGESDTEETLRSVRLALQDSDGPQVDPTDGVTDKEHER